MKGNQWIGGLLLIAAVIAFRTYFPGWYAYYLGDRKMFALVAVICLCVYFFGDKVDLKYYAAPLIVVLVLYLLRDTVLPNLGIALSQQAVFQPMGNVVSQNCPGEPQSITVGQAPVVINPGGKCIVHSKVVSGRVDAIDKHGQIWTYGPEGGGNRNDFWTESVRSSGGGTAEFNYKLNAS